MHDELKPPNHYAKVTSQYSKIHHNVFQGLGDCGKTFYFMGKDYLAPWSISSIYHYVSIINIGKCIVQWYALNILPQISYI
jgi:hypothetical protein